MELPLFSVIDTIRQLGWTGFVELTRNGLALGSLYALIALGYTMVYGILKLLNFAHGDVYMIGAFIGYGVLTAFGRSRHRRHIALVPLIVLMFLGGDARRRRSRRRRSSGSPTARCAPAPRLAPLITALGVSFFLAEQRAAAVRGAVPQLRVVPARVRQSRRIRARTARRPAVHDRTA